MTPLLRVVLMIRWACTAWLIWWAVYGTGPSQRWALLAVLALQTAAVELIAWRRVTEGR